MLKIAATGYTGATTLECSAGGPGLRTSIETRSAEEWLSDAINAAKRLGSMRNQLK